MAWEQSHHAFSARAASAVTQYQPVMLLGALTAASALDEAIIPASLIAGPYFGVARASAAVGDPVDVDTSGYVKCIAGASLGAGAWVVAGSTNGALVIATTGGVASNVKYKLGQAMQNAAAGDIFTVKLDTQQLI